MSKGVNAPLTPSEALALILPPAPRPAPAVDRLTPLLDRLDRLDRGSRVAALDPRTALYPSLYRLLPRDAIPSALHDTGTASRRLRRPPPHHVAWPAVAGSLLRDRS